MDGGYDQVLFCEYMSVLKKNGTDIDVWTLDQLKIIVQDFKQNNEPMEQPQNPTQGEGEESKSHDSFSDNIGSDEGQVNKPSKRLGDESDGDYEQIVRQRKTSTDVIQTMLRNQKEVEKCRKAETELSKSKPEELKINVSDSQVKKGGLFSFSYPTYKITLEPLGWNVRRKESEFVYLRKYLCKHYPNHIIPPLMSDNKLAEE